jgi:hypothetical protein
MNEVGKKVLKDFEEGQLDRTDIEVMHASVLVDPSAYTEEEAEGVLDAYSLFESPDSLKKHQENL